MGIRSIDNMELHTNEGYALLSLNPAIYPLEVVYSAAYILMDRAYVVLDGDPKEELIITVRPKDPKEDVETVARAFNDELINYAAHRERAIQTADLRDAMVKRAFLTHNSE